jgi:hypothetical protein
VTASTLDPQQEWITRISSAVKSNENLPPKYFNNANLRYLWFRNPTNRASLRLTRPGFVAFNKFAQIKFYDIELDQGITMRQLLQLERLFHDPYYIKSHDFIQVSGEQDAVMLQLHAGALGQYLDNLQI